MRKLLTAFAIITLSQVLMAKAQESAYLHGDKNTLLRTHNVCEYYAQLAIFKGDSANGKHAYMTTTGCIWQYQRSAFVDSLLPFTEVLYFSSPEGGEYEQDKLVCLGDSNMLISYYLKYGPYDCDSVILTPHDTLITDKVAGLEVSWDGLIAVIRSDTSSPNLIIYDADFNVLHSKSLNTVPAFVRFDYSLLVVGVNANDETTYSVFAPVTYNLQKDTALGTLVSNPVSFSPGGSIVVAQPGDTMTTVYYYRSIDDTTAIVYPDAAVHQHMWIGNNFVFQPESDSTGFLSNQLLNQTFYGSWPLTIDSIDRRLQFLQSPADANGLYILAMEENNDTTVFYYYLGIYDPFDSIVVHDFPSIYYLDFRCPPLSITYYDDSLVQWKVFPNPTGENTSLDLSGLICGRDYKIDIIDTHGRVFFEKTVQAKQFIDLPTASLEKGIYFVRIHSIKGILVQKLIKS